MPGTATSSPDQESSTDDGSTVSLPIIAIGSVALLLLAAGVAGRDLWFFSDDWNILADYHDGNLLEPFNGHLSLVPAGVYRILFHTTGLDSYLPYRLTGLVALAMLGFQLVRAAHVHLGSLRGDAAAPSRIGIVAAVVALSATAVLWNSAGQMNVLFPFLMNFSLPIAALLAIWWHLDRANDPDAAPVRHEVAASAWLVLALATSGLGLMTMAAVGVELMIGRAPWRRWALLAPGPLLWAAWYLDHRDSSDVSSDAVAVLSYSARMVLGATTSLTAGVQWLGVLLAVALVGYFAVAAWRWRSFDARTAGALAAPATFVLFTAVTRLDIVPAIPPDELRYSWAVGAYLVLAVVVAARRGSWFDVAVPVHIWTAAIIAASVVLALGATRLWRSMQDWNEQVATARPGLSTVLFATEAIGADRIDPDVVIPLSYVPVTTGGYLDAVADVGSPIASATADDLGGAAYNREVADALLVEQLGIRLSPGGRTVMRCESHPYDTAESGEYLLQPGEKVIIEANAPSRVRLARFATSSFEEIGYAEAGTSVLELPADDPSVATMTGLDQRWPYRLSVAPGVLVRRCS